MEKPDMNTPSAGCGTEKGSLPGTCAPMAFPYVPMQSNNPVRLSRTEALQTGTLFPGLDLPFMGMVNNTEKKATPMTQLQTLSFAIQELALYLDTHREDREALELYREYQTMYRQAKEEYTAKIGPLNHMSPSNREEYAWLDDPWPWELCANKEV